MLARTRVSNVTHTWCLGQPSDHPRTAQRPTVPIDGVARGR